MSRLHEIVEILKKSDFIHGITPEKLCNTIEALGPTYIKLGQILSTRVDLLSADYCDALSRLRSQINPIPYYEIENILKDSYPNLWDVFAYIDEEPIGSASIAQVHRAKLRNHPTDVVLKIKRPHIEEVFENDYLLLKKAIQILQLNKIFPVMNLDEVLDQMYDASMEETNFQIELNHLIEFQNHNSNSSSVSCPVVYSDLCRDNVIVMDYINGVKINQIQRLKYEHYDLDMLSYILSDNYIRQALTDGFFHADPHPDNIIVCKEQIIYIDFGMMGRLSSANQNKLKKCMQAIVYRNYDEVSHILVSMSTVKEEVDYISLEKDVSEILEEFGSTSLESISFSTFISKMFMMLRNHHLILDKDVTMLIRGIGILEAVLEELNPNLSLVQVLLREVESNNLEDMFHLKHVKKIGQEIIQSTNQLVEIPGEVSTLLKSVNRGEAKLKVELSDSSKQVDKVENLVHELIIGFLDGCLIIAMVLVEELSVQMILFFLVLFLTIWLIAKMLFDFFHRGY